MAKIPNGIRITGSHIKAVDASVLPRKRFRRSGFDNIRDGSYSRPIRPDINKPNPRTLALTESATRPRLPLILGRTSLVEGIGV